MFHNMDVAIKITIWMLFIFISVSTSLLIPGTKEVLLRIWSINNSFCHVGFLIRYSLVFLNQFVTEKKSISSLWKKYWIIIPCFSKTGYRFLFCSKQVSKYYVNVNYFWISLEKYKFIIPKWLNKGILLFHGNL